MGHKTAQVSQESDFQANAQKQRQAEELSNEQTHDIHPLERITSGIGDEACAAKHVSVIRRSRLFHPMNESQKTQSLLGLQQRYGNRFVQRVIARYESQTKLKVNQTGDVYERESDRVADAAMRIPNHWVQRQPEYEEEEQIQTKPLARQITTTPIQRQIEKEELQAKELLNQAPEITPNLEAHINAIRGGGQPLPASTRAFFEPRFGYDFSQVRVHTDNQAAQLAQTLNARAFTVRRDVVFGVGEYAPETTEGRRLLAHELTHTIQQKEGMSNAPSSRIQRIPQNPQNTPFAGEIIPWSAALRDSPSHSGKVLADLPRGHSVTVTGGRAWISVETIFNGTKMTGYISHELIRATPAAPLPEPVPEEEPSPEPKEEEDNLTKLDELLNRWNIPEEEVITLMGQLTPDEVATVLADDTYKTRIASALGNEEMYRAVKAMGGNLLLSLEWMFYEGTSWEYVKDIITNATSSDKAEVGKNSEIIAKFVSLCNDKTMIEAVNLLELDLETRWEWLEAEGVPRYEIEYLPEFKEELEDVTINSTLLSRAQAFCQHLVDYNLVEDNIKFSEGVRSPSTAHRWSTAYYIRQGTITQEMLKVLPDGKDKDGNLWYKEGWTNNQIKKNAESIWSGARANEGYPRGDPRRLPNTDEPKISTHCAGEAIDIKIRWTNGDGWHEEANALVEQFQLIRPELDEHWHFEVEH